VYININMKTHAHTKVIGKCIFTKLHILLYSVFYREKYRFTQNMDKEKINFLTIRYNFLHFCNYK